METYKNSYTETEDNTLWELHEIRHKLHKERKNKTIKEINREGLEIYSSWQKERDMRVGVIAKRKVFPQNIRSDQVKLDKS